MSMHNQTCRPSPSAWDLGLQNELLVSSGPFGKLFGVWLAWSLSARTPPRTQLAATTPQGRSHLRPGSLWFEPFEHEFVFMRVLLSARTSPSSSASAPRPSGFPLPDSDSHGHRPRAGRAHSLPRSVGGLDRCGRCHEDIMQSPGVWRTKPDGSSGLVFCFEILWPRFPWFLNFRKDPSAPQRQAFDSESRAPQQPTTWGSRSPPGRRLQTVGQNDSQ